MGSRTTLTLNRRLTILEHIIREQHGKLNTQRTLMEGEVKGNGKQLRSLDGRAEIRSMGNS